MVPSKQERKRFPRRVRTPTLLQMEAVECGAAALGIVLAHHGRVVPLEELRVVCGVSRDGSKASNMLKAARTYGLEAKGWRKGLEALADLAMPVIVFWNFNHFLVVEGFGKDRVWLNDPAEGPRSVTWEEFDASFTGVVLTAEPGPDFRKGGQKQSLLGALRRRARGSEAAIGFALLCGLALVVPGIVIPTFSRIFVDSILVQGMTGWLRPLLVGMALTALLRGGLRWLQEYYLLRLETKLAVSSASGFLWHILRLPVEFYSQRYGGEVAGRVALNDRVAAFLSNQLAARFIDAVMVVFFAAMMLTYDVVLTLVGVVAVVLVAGATALVNRRRVDGNRRLLAEQGKAQGTLMGGLSLIETLKASGAESDLFSRWAGYQAKFINAQQELGVVTQSFLAVPPFLVALTNSTVLALGAYRVMEGDLTMGMLVAFQSLMSSFLQPVNNLMSLASTLQEMEGNMNRLDDVLQYEVDPWTREADVPANGNGAGHRAPEPGQHQGVGIARDSGSARAGIGEAPSTDDELAPIEGYLELKDITFGYSRMETPLIEGFSVTLTPGRRVALVGGSGSGKSTLAKIITGIYEPWSGEVLIDGRGRTAWPRRVVANNLALVDQDITLFEGTIRENLSMWDTTVPETSLLKACKDACIHDEITARQGGYDGTVAEGGGNFSGGQAQRIEIARALVNEPRILVLDEATSALDTVTEQRIDRHLRRRGCTCVIVAHRLSTIRDADEIVVLDRGKVVQRGTHEELLADADGPYARLVQEH